MWHRWHQDELRIKRAARLYKRAIKRGFYARWKMFWMVRISRKKERTQKREAQRAIDEADERAAEAARKAAEEAARLKAIEDAKKEARWQEKMEQARYRLKQKEIVAVRGVATPRTRSPRTVSPPPARTANRH